MAFKSSKEFREVMDRTFGLMSTDPEMGPKLRDAQTPQRFEIPDLDLVVDLVPCEDGHAQERTLMELAQSQAQPGELWLADRNFSTRLQNRADISLRVCDGPITLGKCSATVTVHVDVLCIRNANGGGC